jgi:hypothetical protein
MSDERQPMRRYLVVELVWLGAKGQVQSISLDVTGVMDTRESAEAHAQREGGFVIAADWWPRPEEAEEDER